MFINRFNSQSDPETYCLVDNPPQSTKRALIVPEFSTPEQDPPLEKKTKVLALKEYTYKPILDVVARMHSLTTLTLDQIQKRGEFPYIHTTVAKVRALNFDELLEGPLNLPEPLSCKLFYTNGIVFIKAPSKIINKNGVLKKVKPLAKLHGSQRILRPLIGITRCGKMLDLIQLSTNVKKTKKISQTLIRDSIAFEEELYSGFLKDHDKDPFAVTLFLLKEKESLADPKKIRKIKLIQKREATDLTDLINNRDKVPIEFDDMLLYARDILHAVHLCHERMGIVIADIKPDNVLIDTLNKRARLTDFGLAFRVGDTKPANLMRGTRELIPPEVFSDYFTNKISADTYYSVIPQDAKRVNSRDLWAVGTLLSCLFFDTLPQCIYNICGNSGDKHILDTFLQKMYGNKATELELDMFLLRFIRPPFSQEKIAEIKGIKDANQARREKVLGITLKLLQSDPLDRPTEKTMLDEFDALINPIPDIAPPQ